MAETAMTAEDWKYLIDLCGLRIMDVESQAREQCKAGCSMASVQRILKECDYTRELIGKLKSLKGEPCPQPSA